MPMIRHFAIPLLAPLTLLAQGPVAARVSPAASAAAAAIRAESIRADVGYLASDLLEGRGPATRGDKLAQAYVAARMEALGLEPAGEAGGFVQVVDLVGVRTRAPERFAFQRGDDTLAA